MSEVSAAMWPYLVVILVGFLPSEIWRVLGVLLSRGLAEDAEVLKWVRAVAAALLAAVIAKLLLAPSGALMAVPLATRVASVLVGLGGYFALRRSVIAGVFLGEATLIGLTAFSTN